jgi:hypothetical protein
MNSEELNHHVSFFAKAQVGGFYCAAYAIIMGHDDLILARIKTNQNHPKGKCICMSEEIIARGREVCEHDILKDICSECSHPTPENFYDIICDSCHGSFQSINQDAKTCEKCRNQSPAPDSEIVTPITTIPAPTNGFDYSSIEKIESILPALSEQTFMDDEWKKSRRIKLFNDRHFHAKYLIKKKENGTYDYGHMIQYIQFLEECIKDLKTVQQAYMLAKTWHIENENLEARERIKEEDKKYKIKEAKPEKETKEKKTTEKEKKIQEFMGKYYVTKDEAGKLHNLVFGGKYSKI